MNEWLALNGPLIIHPLLTLFLFFISIAQNFDQFNLKDGSSSKGGNTRANSPVPTASGSRRPEPGSQLPVASNAPSNAPANATPWWLKVPRHVVVTAKYAQFWIPVDRVIQVWYLNGSYTWLKCWTNEYISNIKIIVWSSESSCEVMNEFASIAIDSLPILSYLY